MQVVVFTDRTPVKQLELYNTFCRNRTKADGSPDPIVFLYGSIDGVFASIFADFGPKHHVFDLDGVPEKQIVIEHISQADNGVIEVDGERHLLSTGDVVRIEEVVGMTPDGAQAVEGHIYQPTEKVVDINAVCDNPAFHLWR
jgi:hypothetical protein